MARQFELRRAKIQRKLKMNSTTELSKKTARLQRKLLRTTGQEQDRVLDRLIALYRKRAAAFDRRAA